MKLDADPPRAEKTRAVADDVRRRGVEPGTEMSGGAVGTGSLDLRADAEGLATHVHSLAIHLLRRVWARDGETGVSRARASALSVLVFGGPRTLTELAAAEHVTAATMSRLVAALETDGYVERLPHPSDARAVRLIPTAKGCRAMEQARALRIEAMLELLRELNEPELRALARAVEALERALSREPGAGGRW